MSQITEGKILQTLAMTRAEKEERIEKIKQTIFDIEIGTDFMTHEQHNHIRELYAEKRQLEKELKDDN